MSYWTLQTLEATPSLNAWANKRGPYRYGRLRGHWQSLLGHAWYVALSRRAITPAGFTPPARARLSITRESPQQLDPDNLVGGLKPVIDALRRLRLIADDDPASLQLAVRQVRAPACATTLVLEPWED